MHGPWVVLRAPRVSAYERWVALDALLIADQLRFPSQPSLPFQQLPWAPRLFNAYLPLPSAGLLLMLTALCKMRLAVHICRT